MTAPAFSKEETAIRKTVADGLKALLGHTAKHIDATLVDIIRGKRGGGNSGNGELSKSNLKTIQYDSQRRIDIYTRLTNECLLKRDPALFAPATAAATAAAANGSTYGHLNRNKFTAYTVRALGEEAALKDLAALIAGYVKYCDLLSNGGGVYAEPSDEDEDEAERKRQRAALSTEDRNRAVLSRMMCEEGRLLTGLAAAVLFVNRSVKHLDRDLAAVLLAAQNKGGASSSSAASGGLQPEPEESEDVLFKTINIGAGHRLTVSATASLFVRCFPNADALVGLLECSSDPPMQLTALRIIGALAESDPIATIPFIAAVENSVATIGQFVDPERTASHCGSSSNMLLKIQSSAVAVLCELTDPIAIESAQKADAANAAMRDSERRYAAANTYGMEADVDGEGDGEEGIPTPSSVAWAGMSGALQRVIQGALVFDDCLRHLFALAEAQRGAFAKDEVAAEISETVAKTALAVPLMLMPSAGGGGSGGGDLSGMGDGTDGSAVIDGFAVRSPHPSVARSEGSLALVRRIATVISNVLAGNAQTTKTFLQMGYLAQTAVFFGVPPPFAAQCGDENLAPLPYFARNRATRSAASVAPLGVELLIPTACDIVLHCLETAWRDQQRLVQQNAAAAVAANTDGTTPISLGGGDSLTDGEVSAASTPQQQQQQQVSPAAQMVVDQLFHRSTVMKSTLHWASLIGSCAAKSDLIAVTSGGVATFRQLGRVVFGATSLVKPQTRSCVEWLLRTDAVSVKAPITAEHATGYFAAALLPLSPAAMAAAMASASSSSSPEAIAGRGSGGRTAIASFIEDVCLRVPPRPASDSAAMAFVSLLLAHSPASSQLSPAALGHAFAGHRTIADLVAASVVACVSQPNAAPQAIGVRQLSTALLPHVAAQQRRHAAAAGLGGGGGGAAADFMDSPDRASAGGSANGSSARTMTIVSLMRFIGDTFLPSLLAIPDPSNANANGGGGGGMSPAAMTPRTMTPRGSVDFSAAGGMMAMSPSSLSAAAAAAASSGGGADVAVTLSPSSGTAASLFCIALLDAVAALDATADGGCGLSREALATLETAVVSKAAALARQSFEADGALSCAAAILGNASASSSAPSPAVHARGMSPTASLGTLASPSPPTAVFGNGVVGVSQRVLADRLLAWLCLALLHHHNCGGAAEAKVLRCLRDILGGVRRRQRGGGGGATPSAAASRSPSAQAAAAGDYGASDGTAEVEAYGEGGAAEASDDPLALLIDLLCGPFSGVRRLLTSASGGSPLTPHSDAAESPTFAAAAAQPASGAALGLAQFAAVLSGCVGALLKHYGPQSALVAAAALLGPTAASSSISAGGHASSSVGMGRAAAAAAASHVPIAADHSPFAASVRLVRGVCAVDSVAALGIGLNGGIGGGSVGPFSSGGLASEYGGGSRKGAARRGLRGLRGSVAGTSATAAAAALALFGGSSAAGAVGGGGSASAFLVVRDVVVRFVQMQGLGSDDEDSDADGGTASDVNSKRGTAVGAGAGDDSSALADERLAAAKARAAGERDQLGRAVAESRLRAVAEEAALLLQRRRKRIDMMFPLFGGEGGGEGGTAASLDPLFTMGASARRELVGDLR